MVDLPVSPKQWGISVCCAFLGAMSPVAGVSLVERTVAEAQDCVLFLDVPPALEGRTFIALWLLPDGRPRVYYANPLIARAGWHPYDLRPSPDWKGGVSRVSVSLENVTGDVRAPTVWEELEMFFVPEEWLNSSSNLLYGHSLFGFSLNSALLVLFAIVIAPVAAARLIRKRPVLKTAVGIFVCVWALFDFRIMYDHFCMVGTIRKEAPRFRAFGDTHVFMERVAERVGDAGWNTEGKLPWPADIITDYALAEKKRRSDGSARYLVTCDSNVLKVLDRGSPTRQSAGER